MTSDSPFDTIVLTPFIQLVTKGPKGLVYFCTVWMHGNYKSQVPNRQQA